MIGKQREPMTCECLNSFIAITLGIWIPALFGIQILISKWCIIGKEKTSPFSKIVWIPGISALYLDSQCNDECSYAQMFLSHLETVRHKLNSWLRFGEFCLKPCDKIPFKIAGIPCHISGLLHFTITSC